MPMGVFTVLLLGALAAGVVGAGVAKPVVKKENQQSIRHGSAGHFRSHSNFSGK